MTDNQVKKWLYWVLFVSMVEIVENGDHFGGEWQDMGQVRDCRQNGEDITFFTELHGSFTVSANQREGNPSTRFAGRGKIYKVALLPPLD